MGIKVFGELVPCAGCSKAKGRRMAVPWTTECRSTWPLERLFVNLSGQQPRSAGGAQYLTMIVDDYSRMGWRYFLQRKSDVPMASAGFLADINARDTPSIVECIHSDNGTGFTKPEFVALLNDRGIRREYMPVNSPKHDGVVERRIAMTMELVMASRLEAPRLFGDAKMPPTQTLWAEAVRQRRDQHDGKDQGQAGHALAIPKVPRETAVCAAPPVPEAGFSPRKEGPKVEAQV